MISVCVDPARITEAWPHFKDKIESAVSKVGLADFEYIERQVLDGRALLWLAWDGETVHAAAVTQLTTDSVCEIVACGGSGLKKFLPLISDLENFAKAENCRAIRIIGRKGWTKVLTGYEPKAIILERAL